MITRKIILLGGGFILVLLSIIYFLYQTSAQEIDSYMFAPPSCVQSCWLNLVVGKTSDKEVRVFLDANTNDFAIRENPLGFTGLVYDAKYENINLLINIKQGKLSMIGLSGRFNLELMKIIETLGEPDYIGYYIEENGDGRVMHKQVDIFYIMQGYSFSLSEDFDIVAWNQRRVCLEKDSQVINIGIYKTTESIGDGDVSKLL